MKRSILLLVMILASALLAAQEPAIPSPAAERVKLPAVQGDIPAAVVIEDTFDAGNILKGKKIEHAFLVKNTGKAELSILSAKAG